jgi:hypothetical protein
MKNKVHGNETCEIYMNDIILEEMEEIFKYNLSVQTKPRKNPRNEENIMTTNIRKLHAQSFFWKLHNIILCWDFFIVQMITKILMLNMLKLGIVSFVIMISSMHSIKKHEQERD